MRWRLSKVWGSLGGCLATEALGGRRPRIDGQGQSRLIPAANIDGPEALYVRVEPLLDAGRPNWVMLPPGERRRREWWQQRLGETVEIGFGRGAVALALSQLNNLKVAGRVIAVDSPPPDQPGIEGVLALDWEPAEHGLAFDLNCMDGRLDGKTDVGALLDQGRRTVAHPEVLFCPGTGSDGYMERLLPFLSHLGSWAGARWEFAEADLGRLGVVGSLYGWAWLEAGYRLGDWRGPVAVMELDESPLVGLSVVSWTTAGPSGGLT